MRHLEVARLLYREEREPLLPWGAPMSPNATAPRRAMRRALRRPLDAAWLVFLLLAAARPGPAAAQEGGPAESTAKPGELIVVWRAGAPAASSGALRAAAASAVVAALAGGAGPAAWAAGGGAPPEALLADATAQVQVLAGMGGITPEDAARASGGAAGGGLRASLVRLAGGAVAAAGAVKARLEQMPDVDYVQPNFEYTAVSDAPAPRRAARAAADGGLHNNAAAADGVGSAPRALQELAGRNRKCGAKAAAACGADLCCSSKNRCGSSLEACGAGCQAAHGRCTPRLAREPLKAGEQALAGMGRIQALRAARSADRAAPQVPIYDAATNITVAILDTGIARHPDLNVAGGRGFIAGAAPASWSDAFAHGTHVAGIVGGANDGAGVYGVLPGVRLFAGKVLSDSGKGDSLTVAAGIQWVADFGVDQEGIVVINLSLAGAGADPLVCAAAAAAAARGAVVLAAAGNNGRDLRGVMPANCPGVIAVTALDSRDAGPRGHPKPAYFSNWLPANAPDADRARTVAAPGTAIQSTTLGAAFTVASGTSAACPHAAGVAARCFAAGDCKLSDGAKNTVKVAGSAFEKLKADASFRWSRKDCTAVVVGERRYFGPLIWADYW